MDENYIKKGKPINFLLSPAKVVNSPAAVIKPDYVMTAEQILGLGITEVSMLCSPILQKVGVASLCGSSDGGKSYLCLCLAISICSTKLFIA